MTLPDIDGLAVQQATLEVTLTVIEQHSIALRVDHYWRCGYVLPTELILTYRRTPAAPRWSAYWAVRGYKLLKRGDWSGHVGAYLNHRDVDTIPDWVVAALRAHHPDPDQLTEEDLTHDHL